MGGIAVERSPACLSVERAEPGVGGGSVVGGVFGACELHRRRSGQEGVGSFCTGRHLSRTGERAVAVAGPEGGERVRLERPDRPPIVGE